ncbi:branched-chain amino acid aminotransferase [Fusibacter sp. 3D3]|nr:branched-chain amino acid aminotransferase [Fusibacter sp. 3D3]
MKNGAQVDINEEVRYLQSPVYEVIRIIEGTPLFFQEHMKRFQTSLELVNYECAYSSETIFDQIKNLIETTGLKDNNIRLEYGVTDLGMILMLFMVKSEYPNKSFYEQGVRVKTACIVRGNPHAKLVNKHYLEQISALKAVSDVYEIILKNEAGKIAEGSKSNLFFIKDQTIYSAKEADILMGITRLELMAIFEKLDLTYIELDIYEETLERYEACFLSGTSIGVLPIESVNEMKYNSTSNHVIIKLMGAYNTAVKNNLENTRRLYL